MTLSFTLVTTVLVSVIGFYIYHSFTKKALVQSTESSLRLVSGTISQEIAYLETVSDWCCSDDRMLSFLQNKSSTSGDALDVYNSFSTEYQNCRVSEDILRLVVTDTKFTKVLQVGKVAGDSSPVTIYNIRRFFPAPDSKIHAWENIVDDPFSWSDGPDSRGILLTRPIYYSSSNKVVGYLSLLASTNLITNSLKEYHIEPDSDLYLSLGENNYSIQHGRFIQEPLRNLQKEQGHSLSRNVSTFRDDTGATRTLVRCKIGDTDMILSNSISNKELESQQNVFLCILVVICFCIVALGITIFAFLNRAVTTPVLKIQSRIKKIAKGDFSYDPGIEWENELGDIGRGINKLSRNVNSLMEKRLADEKERQDMEYQLLQNQISPHFLYNALNSIKWMATIQGASGISAMTTSLSHLMKSISKGTKKIIPLHEEIHLVDDYFLIQKYRFGGSITMVKEIDENVKQNMILRFTLQPLVENAISHGIEPKGGAGTIRIVAGRTESGDVAITVSDDGVGMDSERIDEIFDENTADQSESFRKTGIRNVYKRIRYEFGSRYGLSVTSEQGCGTTVTILLPDRPCEN